MTFPETADRRRTAPTLAVLFAGLLLVGGLFLNDAGAQGFGEAFKDFSASSEDPIQIEADRLEVRDQEKIAIYAGNVRVRQGETVLRTAQLRVFYTGEATGVTPGSSVSRIEASNRVVVRSGSQTASGDKAVFEMAADRITLTGNVVLTEGDNIVRGNKLVVDLKSRKARMEGNRVQTILTPGRVQNRN
jgi:lipopolysaccharide export system protein LptA